MSGQAYTSPSLGGKTIYTDVDNQTLNKDSTYRADECRSMWEFEKNKLIFTGTTTPQEVSLTTLIAEYVEDKWGQCVNVRIAAWMNTVTPAWRGREEWPVSEECKNSVMPWEQDSFV